MSRTATNPRPATHRAVPSIWRASAGITDEGGGTVQENVHSDGDINKQVGTWADNNPESTVAISVLIFFVLN